MRALAAIICAAALVGVVLVPATHLEGGGRTLWTFWCVALAIAALPALALPRIGRPAALLSGLLALAAAGACALTKSTWLHYLYMRPWELRERPDVALGLLFLALQAIAVVAGLRRRAELRRGLLRFLDRRALLVLGAALLLTSVHVTLLYPNAGEPRYWIWFGLQLVAMTILVVMNVAHLALIAASLPANWLAGLDERRLACERGEGALSVWRGRLPKLAALWVTIVSALVAYFVMERVPHVPDGIAYLFQAECIAQGAFAAPAPPVVDAFEVYLLDVRDGQWFAVTNPGWPMLLALGVLFGAFWLVNPVLGGLTVLATHGLLRRLLDRRAADIGTCMLALSPWMLFLSSSLMTHLATQLFGTIGWLLAFDAWKERRADKGFLAGAALGFVCLVRPLDGLLMGLVAGAGILWAARAALRRHILVLASFSLGAILVTSALLIFSWALTGDPAEPPINAYIAELWPESTNRLGFGPEVGNPPQGWGPLDPIPGHGWRDVLLNTNQNLVNLQLELFGWPFGSLLLIALLLVRGGAGRMGRAALLVILLLVAGYNLYWFSGGPDFGPRYWFSMLVPLLVLSVLGLRRLLELAPDDGNRRRRAAAVCAAFLLVTPVFFCWRIEGRYHRYRGFHPGYRQFVEERELSDALIFVETDEEVDFGSALILNDPFLARGRPIFVRDLGLERNAAAMRAFKGRRLIWVRGPDRPGGPVREVDPRR